MTQPNAMLMRHYGTESDFLQKEAGLSPFARRMLMAMIASKLQRGMSNDLDASQQQAAAFNNEFLRLQLQKMGPSIESIHHTNPPVFASSGGDIGAMPYQVPLGMDTGMVRVASALGAELAQMDKRAGIFSSLAQTPVVQGAAKRIGGGVGGLFGRLGSAVTKPAGAALGGAASKVVAPVKALAASPVGQAAGQIGSAVGTGVKQVGADALHSAKSIGRGVATAGAIGLGAAGIGAYALAKPTLGYLSKEQQPANWGHADYGAPQLAYGVNQYGQPNYGAPFIR